MAPRFPQLNTADLPPVSEDEIASPARGTEMRKKLLQQLRAPPFVHVWEFWHDRQGRTKSADAEGAENEEEKRSESPNDDPYEARLKSMHEFSDAKGLWGTLNNLPWSSLQLRDSIHLFKKGTKPVWEDPRNYRGGCWTFRVPKEDGIRFFKEIACLATGEIMQEALNTDRTTFKDEICGVSISVRFTSHLITVWNRDGDHKEGIQRLKDVILSELSEDLIPKPSAYYYKKHSEHSGFKAPVGLPMTDATAAIVRTVNVTTAAGGQ
ncbi:translation initiation factor eIF4e [Lepidopterella palustris CBS 459.81]|uniref:Translation initiation factor eIF4e n=1 Tax=Lepidopterella palustris CBS 459.81 TaxID=1314670 RepID=A0A8E2EAP8_9PEZI|nr:translation initiation factor eIF4e [Lepidopterella palustris CBS 459.81]